MSDIKQNTEIVPVGKLKNHPRNYRTHPDDQIEHIKKSIEQNGIYRPFVVASDYTILAGHGVYQAVLEMDISEVPVVKIDIDPESPQALKILTGDNEISHLGEVDDRALTEILKDIKEFDIEGLVGTGYDEMMLANLVFVTRPQSEIAGVNEAAEWVGMPEYEPAPIYPKIVMSFLTLEDKIKFINELGLRIIEPSKPTHSVWWPEKKNDDPSSVKFE